ncbi:MAG: DNA gyrase inhibitor YacG [Saezia sp.]
MESEKKPFRKKIVNCPRCHKETLYAPENEWRPFCSQRCYEMDLGAWASEGYRIPSNEEDPNEEEHNQAP